MWIRKNYTNFTTDKPAVFEQSSPTTPFGSGRDIAYLVFSILQFGITVFGLVWVNYIIRQKDKKDEKERLEKERKDEMERLEKEQRDKIADIINNEYNKIVVNGIVDKLRKCREKFEAIVMFYGSVWETGDRKYKITGLDVLRFMLRNPNDFKDEPLKKLQEDLDVVISGLFRTLRIKLPLTGDCPVNIKEELGPLITDVGEITWSFVSARNRYTITNVLKYFANVWEVVSIRNEEKRDGDDDRKVRRFLPYVNSLFFGETFLGLVEMEYYHDRQVLKFDLPNPRKDRVMTDLRKINNTLSNNETIRAEDLTRFTEKINAIWNRHFQRDVPIPDWSTVEHLPANIVHAIRVFILKVQEGGDIIQDEEFKKLVGEIENRFSYYNHDDPSAVKMRGQKAIVSIQSAINTLRSDEYAHLCELKSVVERLERAFEDINCNIISSNNE